MHENPPIPAPIGRVTRLRCWFAGIRDRRIQTLDSARHTPWTRRLEAECHRGELTVMSWLLDQSHPLDRALAQQSDATSRTLPILDPPRHVRDELWDARRRSFRSPWTEPSTTRTPGHSQTLEQPRQSMPRQPRPPWSPPPSGPPGTGSSSRPTTEPDWVHVAPLPGGPAPATPTYPTSRRHHTSSEPSTCTPT